VGQQRTAFLLALRQAPGGIAKLEERFWQVSEPRGKSYRNFLARKEIDSLVRAAPSDMEAVMQWLEVAGIPKERILSRSDSVLVNTNVSVAERVFGTRFYIYVHSSGHTILRNFGAYSVPKALRDVIQLTEGVTDFPMHRSSARRQPGSPLQANVVPQTLAALYKYADTPVPAQAIQMPAEFQDDSAFSPSDLKTFFKDVALPDQRDTHRVGPFNDQVPDVEATLDTQYISAVGLGVDNWYWTSEGWMYTFANNLYNHKELPNVVSISWGWAEDQQCSVATVCDTLGVDSQQYVQRVNTEFMKLGAMGVSLFVASGDSGANGRSDPTCTDKKLHAVFPASSPYVTAVGATMLRNAQTSLRSSPPVCSRGLFAGTCASGGDEVAVSAQQAGFTSGGGFSDYVPRPRYQDAAVRAYLQSGVALPPASYYNATGRGFPDVAAMGNNFLIYIKSEGGWQTVGGTSASAPTWAGVASRLVDLALMKTGRPLGFMNPLLYQMHADLPEAFADVTVGDNRCTESGCAPRCKGFECARGWDPVTGLGTPRYDAMAAYLTGLLSRQHSSGLAQKAASEVVV